MRTTKRLRENIGQRACMTCSNTRPRFATRATAVRDRSAYGLRRRSRPGAPPPPVVTVAHPLARSITDWDEYTGRIEPVESVEVRARVSGYLQSVHFDEGGMVEEGDLLFVIDPRPYRAVLEQATCRAHARAGPVGARAATIAIAPIACSSRARFPRKSSTRARRSSARPWRRSRRPKPQSAPRSSTSSSREVRAPIGGRIGRLHVTRGNLVSGGTEGSTLLTTIVSVDPVYVYFTGDEREYLKYSRLNLEGARPSSRDFANPVRMRLADEKDFPREGRMDFVANTLDEASGTIQGARLVRRTPTGC